MMLLVLNQFKVMTRFEFLQDSFQMINSDVNIQLSELTLTHISVMNNKVSTPYDEFALSEFVELLSISDYELLIDQLDDLLWTGVNFEID